MLHVIFCVIVDDASSFKNCQYLESMDYVDAPVAMDMVAMKNVVPYSLNARISEDDTIAEADTAYRNDKMTLS